MTIVMGLDQHRAQITAEWLDTETGESTRSQITFAQRHGVRRFCEKFRGQKLEVALEATTGWRFVADELRRAGAVVHLAEPAETAAGQWPGRAGCRRTGATRRAIARGTGGSARSNAVATRALVLDAAGLMAAGRQASIVEIASAVEVSRSTLFGHFLDRQEIFAALR